MIERHSDHLVQGPSNRPLGIFSPPLPIPDEIEQEPVSGVTVPEPLPTSHSEDPPLCVPNYTQEDLTEARGSNNTKEVITGWTHRVAEEFDLGDVGCGSAQLSEVSDGCVRIEILSLTGREYWIRRLLPGILLLLVVLQILGR